MREPDYEGAWRQADAGRTAAVEKCVTLEAKVRALERERDALREALQVILDSGIKQGMLPTWVSRLRAVLSPPPASEEAGR